MSVKQVFNTSAELDYPTVLPTLDLDFANSKTLDPRITFTRSSGGSYVGADGLIKLAGVNEARFDHDPVTGESLGLLVEESRTNLITYSTYNPSWWANVFPVNATLSTGIDAPDGSNTAVRFSCTPTGSSLLRLSFPSFTPNGTTAFTCSFYARLISGTTSTANALLFDLADRPGGNYLPFLVKDKWVRVVFTETPSSAFVISFMDLLSDNSNNYTIDYWGAQLEAGSFPTSYIPTVASTRTRASDNASITGKNFSSFYNPSEGTIFAASRINALGGSNYPGIAYVDDGTNANCIGLTINDAGTDVVGAEAYVSNSNQYYFNSSPAVVANQLIKAITTYKVNDFAGAFNIGSNTVQTDTSGSVPTVNRLIIGDLRGSSAKLNGTISQLSYYPKRLPNSQLISLTS